MDEYTFNSDEAQEQVSQILKDIKYLSGYAMEPLAFRQLFKRYLDKYHPSQINIEKARTIAGVFACILNHYILHAEMHPVKIVEVFISERDWQEEYCFSKKAVKNSIKILREIGLIDYKNRWDKQRQIRRRWYIVYIPAFVDLLNRAERLKMLKFKASRMRKNQTS